MLLSRKKALVMISLKKTQEGRTALGLCLEQLLCIILTAQNDDPMQKHVLIVDFKSFFTGAIKKNLELRHHTDDETYIPLLKK